MGTSARCGILLLVLLFAVGCGPNAVGPHITDDGGGGDGSPVLLDGGRDGALDGPFADDGGQVDAPQDDGPVLPAGSILIIDPVDAAVYVATGAQATIDYRVTLRVPAQFDTDVTGESSLWLDDTSLGAFTGARLVGALGASGTTNVHAAARGLTAQTTVTLGVQSVVLAPGVAADAPTKFGGATTGAAPTIIYPNDGILVPPNLNVFEFHFMPGAGNTLFSLSFHQGSLSVDYYFTCTAVGGGCAYAPDQAAWSVLASTMRGRDAVTYTLRGVNGATPGAVGVSASQTIRFADLDIHGGIYYWAAGAGLIKRYEFGVSGQTAETYLNRAQAGATFCVGCHVVSANGQRIAAGNDIPAPSPYKVYDVATRTPYYSQGTMIGGGANFFSFSPDAGQIMTSSGSTIVLRNSNDGTPVPGVNNPLVSKGAMPDWAANGAKMVYAEPPTAIPLGADGVTNAKLRYLTNNGGTWSSPTTLVDFGGQNNYYPTYSPDSAWVLFDRCTTCLSPSSDGGTGSSYDARDAELWVVSAAGGTPIRLARATTANGDSWPKWAPVVQTYMSNNIMWITWSSRRNYGLRSTDGTAQLWMAAIDPALASSGSDPSYPAFWLPFQELGSGNHIAQWATAVERQPCTGPGQCASGELCENGRCVPGPSHQ
jgi:hypothetical protein